MLPSCAPPIVSTSEQFATNSFPMAHNVRVELTDLRHFFPVAATGSFGRGARLSHVSPPAVSKAVRKLEDELGARLFQRTTRSVRLTPAGEALRARCERI